MNKLFYVMGKSSSGKDTIYNRLMSDETLMLKKMTGYTTRPKREGEVQGQEYHFVDVDKLKGMESENKVIECRCYDTVYGKWYYFTADSDSLRETNDNFLMIGTLESFEKVREYYGSEVVIPIYIQVEDGLRLERAMAREKSQSEPKYEEMCRRFLADQKDFSEENLGRLGIERRFENVELKKCYGEIVEYISGVLDGNHK